MPHDPARAADTREWLAKAFEDDVGADSRHLVPARLSARLLRSKQETSVMKINNIDLIPFALKGFLAWHDVPFRKTHNLEEIGEACLKIDATLLEIMNRAVPLTEYAWKFRYPGEPREPTLDEVETALTVAREVYGAILARLPGEAHP